MIYLQNFLTKEELEKGFSYQDSVFTILNNQRESLIGYKNGFTKRGYFIMWDNPMGGYSCKEQSVSSYYYYNKINLLIFAWTPIDEFCGGGAPAMPFNEYLWRMEDILGIPRSEIQIDNFDKDQVLKYNNTKAIYEKQISYFNTEVYQIKSNFWFESVWHYEVLCVLIRSYTFDYTINFNSWDSWVEQVSKAGSMLTKNYLKNKKAFLLIKNITKFGELSGLDGFGDWEKEKANGYLFYYDTVTNRYINGIDSLIHDAKDGKYKKLFDNLEALEQGVNVEELELRRKMQIEAEEKRKRDARNARRRELNRIKKINAVLSST